MPEYPISDKERFLSEARRDFREASDAESELRKAAAKTLRFVAGDQWDADIKAQRVRAGRPAHTHNRLRTFVNQLVNEARQQKPQIRFSPVEGADEATADVLTGMARHIQYDSQASIAYETAALYQGACGFGYFRILTEFCDYGGPFDQDVKIRMVPDPLSVYGVLMPAIRGQKCRRAFVCESMSRDEYKAQFGESLDFASFVDDGDGWITADEVRIAEYWRLETTKRTIVQLQDGSIVPLEQVPEGTPILNRREIDEDTVHFCKLNGAEILPDTETEWVGSSISIIPVLGEQLIVDGKPQLNSLVTFMLDPQKLINVTKSRIAESLYTAPISPFMVLEGQITGREPEWMTMNTTLRPVIQYKPVRMPDGTMFVQSPQRQTFEPPIAALSAFLAQEIDELKAISGIYDASLGNRSNETSGIAIARRQQQSDTANMHFMDNLARAHEQAGRILAEIIPRVYSAPRMVKILGEDEAQKIVAVNQVYQDKDGTQKYHNLNAGTYDVTVTTGRSFSTKKLETFQTLADLVSGNPQLMPMIGDIVFRNSDMAGAEEISDRFKKMLPPQLQAPEDGQQPLPPEIQQQMAHMNQMVQQLANENDQLKAEGAMKKAELESNERIEAAKLELQREELQAKIILEQSKMASNEDIVELREQLAMVKFQIQQVQVPLEGTDGESLEDDLARSQVPGQAQGPPQPMNGPGPPQGQAPPY